MLGVGGREGHLLEGQGGLLPDLCLRPPMVPVLYW